MNAKQKQWLPQLDGLRAIAVNLVFVHHWVPNPYGLGIMGVQLFFVLSGFLITGILLRERDDVESGRQSISFSARQFYIRRFLRIFPLYYFCLFLCLALGRFEIRQTFLWHFFYLSNVLFFLRDTFYVPFAHFWSLAVEEQFYLFWPWVVLLAPRRLLKSVLVFLICLAPVTRGLMFASGRADFVQTNTLVWANLDTLGIGALLACLTLAPDQAKQEWSRYLSWAASFCLVELVLTRVIRLGVMGVWLDPIAVAIVAAWLVWNASLGFKGTVGALLAHPAVVYLGRISYGLYVWHMFAPVFLRNALRVLRFPVSLNEGAIGYLLLFVWTVATASLTWFLFEKPINGLKRHFQYRKADQVLAQPLVEIPS